MPKADRAEIDMPEAEADEARRGDGVHDVGELPAVEANFDNADLDRDGRRAALEFNKLALALADGVNR